MNQTRCGDEVKAVGTTMDIVAYLHNNEGGTIEEIAEAVEIGTSTAHRHLITLQERGYVVTEEGEYRLSLMFLTHGGKARTRIPANQLIEQKVRQISEETGERAQFLVEEHGDRVYVCTHVGPNAVKTDAAIGKRGPLHMKASGKAILANLPPDRLDSILGEEPYERATPNTITDRETLEAELEKTREQGYALNDEESTDGLRAVGVSIEREDGSTLGAISLSGPANRLTGDYFQETLPDLLLGTVNEIELNLKYS